MSALSNRRLRRLNLRQRKKRHVGEFQELLFRADARFHDALSPEAFEAWVHEFLSLMEGRQLLAVVGGGKLDLASTSAMVFRDGRGSPSEDDRQAVLTWLQARPEVAEASVDAFVDAWYGHSR